MSFVSRFGMYAQKLGMSRIFLGKKVVAITLLKVPKNYVLEKKDLEGHSVIKLGVSECKGKIKKPQLEELKKLGKAEVENCVMTKEFKVTQEEAAAVGEFIDSSWINVGSLIDLQSKSVGKGFAGAMKRWNFSGSSASHGASLSHRAIGSTGTRDKIFKNRKMPGRLGQDVVTIQNQEVVFKDEARGLIGILGSVPGKAGTWVKVSKVIKNAAKVTYGN